MDRSILASHRTAAMPSHIPTNGVDDDDTSLSSSSEASQDDMTPSRWGSGRFVDARGTHKEHHHHHNNYQRLRLIKEGGQPWTVGDSRQYSLPTSHAFVTIALSGRGAVWNALGLVLRRGLIESPEEFDGVLDWPRDPPHFQTLLALLARTTPHNIRAIYAVIGRVRASGRRGEEVEDEGPIHVPPFSYRADPWGRMIVPLHIGHGHEQQATFPPFLKPAVNVGIPWDDPTLYVLFPTREIGHTSVDHSLGPGDAYVPIQDSSFLFYVMGTRHETWKNIPSSFAVHRSTISNLLSLYAPCTWDTIVLLCFPPPDAWVSGRILTATERTLKAGR